MNRNELDTINQFMTADNRKEHFELKNKSESVDTFKRDNSFDLHEFKRSGRVDYSQYKIPNFKLGYEPKKKS